MATPGSPALQKMVLVAVVSMLLGTILVIMAGGTQRMTVAPGDTLVAVDHATPDWDVLGRDLEVRIFGPANFTFEANGSIPPEQRESEHTHVEAGFVFWWNERTAPGQNHIATVTNDGEDPIVVSVEVQHRARLWAGAVLVAFGLLGFVFYKKGMGTS